MFKPIDFILDRITMYRLVLYYLIGLLVVAAVLSVEHVLPYNPVALLLTTLTFLGVCWLTNTIFAGIFQAPTNVESVYISALILALIVTPAESLHDLEFVIWAGVLAMASKYILAINRKHVFNPVALAVAVTALAINQSATWWVGTLPMLPFVVVGGLLIVRKIRRFDLVFSFVATALVTTLVLGLFSRTNLITTLQTSAISSPLFFFAFIILTEPLTTPPTQSLQVCYGALTGVLFAPQIHIGTFYFTPELAMLVGNLFSYIVSPKTKLVLRLKEKIQIAGDAYDFIFTPNRKMAFAPGQYMEWTLAHDHPDSRGNRRYFTLASAPTEYDLRVGVKFYEHSSSFKQSMLAMDENTEIVASQLAGDFVLPKNRHQRCVFIAGGIGITPFRSMMKYLLDSGQQRPITLFYLNKTAGEIVYRDVFERAQQRLGIRTIYALTGKGTIPAGWRGKVGRMNPQWIREEVPGYKQCIYYISGPNAMVTATEDMLHQMGIKPDHIKTDFFPGLV